MSLAKIFINKGKTMLNLENYLKSELGTSGYSGMTIQRTPLSTRIVLNVERPPIVIGKAGSRINELTEKIKEKFGIDDPAIDVQGVKDPYLDAQIMAMEIATAIEKGENPQRVAKRALEAMRSHGAVGAQVKLSGKLVGKGERGRTEKFYDGYMKKSGFPLNSVNVGKVQSKLKQGIIGVEVRILQPNISFPDQVKIKQITKSTSTSPVSSSQSTNNSQQKTQKINNSSTNIQASTQSSE